MGLVIRIANFTVLMCQILGEKNAIKAWISSLLYLSGRTV